MKKIIKEYIDSAENEDVAVEQRIMSEGFDFIERRAAWRGMISDTFAEIEKEEVQKTHTRRLWHFAAAAIVLLLVAFGGWVFNSQTNKKLVQKPYIQQGNSGDKSALVADASAEIDKLLAKSVDDFQATIVRKGSSDADNWQSDFQLAKYIDVIHTLEAVGKKRTVEQTYFLAQAYLKIDPKNTLKAQSLFKTVSAENSEYAKDALWSYALICLMHKQKDEAKMALDTVRIISNAHSAEAEKLRKTLK
jgi:hypothetical protein